MVALLFVVGTYLLRKVMTSQPSTFHEKLCNHLSITTSREHRDVKNTPLVESDTSQSCLSEEQFVSDVTVNFDDVIGVGKFGSVYRANGRLVDGSNVNLAFKVAHDFSESARCHRNEVYIYEAQQTQHNIVTYYGTCIVKCKSGLLTEYCSQGNLRNFLEMNSIEIKLCVSMLYDVTSAIAYLHRINYDGDKPRIAHRDLCSSNFLVRGNHSLALSDFGSSMVIDDVTNDVTDARMENTYAEHLVAEGTPFYVAPEVLDLSINLRHQGEALTQADVYSMSLVMWEVVTQCKEFNDTTPPHSLPYQHDVNNIHELIDHVVVRKNRPAFKFDTKKSDFVTSSRKLSPSVGIVTKTLACLRHAHVIVCL
uniref:receptor protein serine/threonine kinase n=1 Tax=Ciona savignyi TaxID=51511 RepID=H2Y4P7_CIOSA